MMNRIGILHDDGTVTEAAYPTVEGSLNALARLLGVHGGFGQDAADHAAADRAADAAHAEYLRDQEDGRQEGSAQRAFEALFGQSRGNA